MEETSPEDRAAESKAGGRDRLVLITPVVAAVLTATLGVALSQWIDACNRAGEAENTARVLEQNLITAEDALNRSILDERYRLYDLNVDISIADQKLLADRLEDDYDDVAEAAAAYSLQLSRAREKHEFAQYDVIQLACAKEKVARGRRALSDLTGSPMDPVTTDVKDHAARCRAETIELVAEQFYDAFVDGNGIAACENVVGKAIAAMRKESPRCGAWVPAPAHSDALHPHASAEVQLAESNRRAQVTLRSATTNGEVGTLVMTYEKNEDEDDTPWHIDQIHGLKSVSLPKEDRNDRRHREGSRQERGN